MRVTCSLYKHRFCKKILFQENLLHTADLEEREVGRKEDKVKIYSINGSRLLQMAFFIRAKKTAPVDAAVKEFIENAI